MTTRFAGVGTMGQFGFFDADRRLAAITAKGDPLEMIARVVPFESFRAEIEAAVLTPVNEKKGSHEVGGWFEVSSREWIQQLQSCAVRRGRGA